MQAKRPYLTLGTLWLLTLGLLLASSLAPNLVAQVVVSSPPLVTAMDIEEQADPLIVKTPSGYCLLTPTDSSVLCSGLDTVYQNDRSRHFIAQSTGKWGLINYNTGKPIIPFLYDTPPKYISPGAWRVKQSNKLGLYADVTISLDISEEWGKYRTEMKCIIPPTMNDVRSISPTQRHSLVLVSQDGLYGVYWTSGKVFLPIAYDYIGSIGDYLYTVRNTLEGKQRAFFNISASASPIEVDDLDRLTCNYYDDWLDPLGCVYVARRGKQQGLLDERAQWLIPLDRQTISMDKDQRIMVHRRDKTTHYTLQKLLELASASDKPTR